MLAVVWFHSGLPGLPGGFAGVDVFFVISGFLITSIIHRDVQAGRFSFARFYERRFRRIAPALVTVTAATVACGYVVLLPYELVELGKSAAATVGMAANIYFWRSADYFAFAHGIMPLLHNWSLGVEEQFYLFFPAFLLFAERFNKAKAAVAVAGGVSFLLCVAGTRFAPGASFYLLPTRGWELMIGAAIALGRVALPPRAKEAGGLAGLALILGGFALLSEGAPFPGWRALLPTAGAALVIAGGRGSRACRALRWKPLVFVGRVSYSFYLWHWPVLVFMRHWRGDLRLPVIWAAGALLLSFLLAVASYRWIEQPARRQSMPFRNVLAPVVALAVAILAASAAAVAFKGLPQRLPSAVDEMAARHEQFAPFAHTCTDIGIEAALERCHIGPEGAPQFLLWGDSHAAAIGEAASVATGRPGVLISMAACPPVLGWQSEDSDPVRCPAANQQALRLAQQSTAIRTVILSAFWGAAEEEGGEQFWRGVQQVVDPLRASGKRVVVIAGIPDPGLDVPWTSAIRQRFGRPPVELTCRKARIPLRGVAVIDVSSGFCSRPASLLYRDANHPSRYAGLTIIAPAIAKALAR